MKKLIALLLALMIVVACFAGCSDNNEEDKKEIATAIPSLRQQCFARSFTEMMIGVAEVSTTISATENPLPADGLSGVMEKVCRPKTINKFLVPDYAWSEKPLDKTIKDLESVLTFLKKLRQVK